MRALFFIITIMFAFNVSAQTIAIKGGTIHTVSDQGTIQNGTILIENGKIAAVGDDIDIPNNAQIIEASGKPIVPGFMHSGSTISIKEYGKVDNFDESLATGSIFNAAFEVTYGINPASQTLAENRRQGLTRTVVAPGFSGHMFHGGASVIALTSDNEMLIKEGPIIASLMDQGNRNTSWAMLHHYFDQVSAYKNGDEKDFLLSEINMDALIPVLNGDRQLALYVNGVNDIRNAIKFKQKFGLKLILVGVREAWKVADEIKAADIPLIIDPAENLPGDFDSLWASYRNAAELEKAGVTFAIAHDLMEGGRSAYLLMQMAGIAVAHGLSWDGALEAITLNPAKIFGIDRLYGSIEVGKEADIVIWDADPMEFTSNVDHVFVRGKEYDVRSRRTRLRDRYMDLDNPKPFAYRE